MVGAREYTILVVDDAEYTFAGRVIVCYALCVHHGACLFGHMWQQFRQQGVELLLFLGRDRCSGIALDTTTALAMLKVAAELLLKYLQTNYCILYQQHICLLSNSEAV